MTTIQTLQINQEVEFTCADESVKRGVVTCVHPHTMLLSKKYWVRSSGGAMYPIFFHPLFSVWHVYNIND